jgi:hypothetical protein
MLATIVQQTRRQFHRLRLAVHPHPQRVPIMSVLARDQAWLPQQVHGAEWSDLAAAGIKIDPSERQRHLNLVRLPWEWTLQFNRLTYMRELRDDRNRLRAHIDLEYQLGELRSATMRTVNRYCVYLDYDESGFRAYAFDGETEQRVFESGRYERNSGEAYFDGHTRVVNEVEAWLNTHYPDWKKFNAYR